jgi:hypothetical protein
MSKETQSLHLRVSAKQHLRINALAALLNRTVSSLGEDAIDEYLTRLEGHIRSSLGTARKTPRSRKKTKPEVVSPTADKVLTNALAKGVEKIYARALGSTVYPEEKALGLRRVFPSVRKAALYLKGKADEGLIDGPHTELHSYKSGKQETRVYFTAK